ncbi:MAG: hypothetical protein JJLCMIEE_03206 [Acidimicrobiales bacterium]|nr:MAG: diacylglycerol kinase [Actinomycetota bacterium]MBV6510086.1 hypothetical protein [Acidimicrobiales bacterium]RIK03580.1 MAG: diacylglycerol kinase [Acidobacteriota bacterium]
MSSAVPARRRVAAGAALAILGLLIAVVVVFLWRNGAYVVIGLAGLGVAVAGAWWVVTEGMPRRAVGSVGMLAGLVIIGLALTRALHEADRVALRLVVVLGLLALAMAAARAALVHDIHRITPTAREPRPPVRPVLLCNPWSGGGKVEKFGLVELASRLGVETVMLDHGLDLEQLARDAVARGADCLGMAGGDGSQALVASIAVEHDLPFVCISAGTRNHFALDLGLDRDDPRQTMYAFRDAVERRIDYATAGERFFVNNVSLGIYATIVQEDGYRDAKVDTTKMLLPEMLGRRSEPFDLQFTTPDGTQVEGAFLVQVSNNPYVLGASPDTSQRRHLDSGCLGVFAVSTKTGAEAARLLALSALGQRRRSPYWHEFTAEAFEIRSRSGKAFAGIDGEAIEVETPLRFRSHPLGLRLLVPAGNLEAAERRRARDVSVKRLLAVLTGHAPD